jgi:hypothetical protein
MHLCYAKINVLQFGSLVDEKDSRYTLKQDLANEEMAK